MTHEGYLILTLRGHPLARVNGAVLAHRAVLYDTIGPGTHACHWCEADVTWEDGSLTGDHGNVLPDKRREVALIQPPSRRAVCAHDVRGPLRQACCCCGACDHLDYRVDSATWDAVVPAELSGAHVCLRCFDALAHNAEVDYADKVEVVHFVGDRAVLELRPALALDVS